MMRPTDLGGRTSGRLGNGGNSQPDRPVNVESMGWGSSCRKRRTIYAPVNRALANGITEFQIAMIDTKHKCCTSES